MIDKVTYEAFKDKCRMIVLYIPEHFLIFSIVIHTLQLIFDSGDTTSIDEKIGIQKSIIEYFQNKLKIDVLKKEDIETLNELVRRHQNFMKDTDSTTRKCYSLYEYFCENVVKNLLIEKTSIKKED